MRLHEIIKEDAGGGDAGGGAATGSVGAGSVAGFRQSLFGSNKLLTRNRKRKKLGSVQMIRYNKENNWNRN